MSQDKPVAFVKEPRYIVFKLTDVNKYLMQGEKEMLKCIGDEIATCRSDDGKPPFNAVVVEEDWPEFDPVRVMIEAWVTGKPVAAQEPFCYMSEQFEVALFTEQPTDPRFSDMFPVYRSRTDAEAKIADQAAQITSIRDAMRETEAFCKRKDITIRMQASQIAQYRAEMSAAVEAGFCSAQDIYTSYLGQADKLAKADAVILSIQKFINSPISVESCRAMNVAIEQYQKGE